MAALAVRTTGATACLTAPVGGDPGGGGVECVTAATVCVAGAAACVTDAAVWLTFCVTGAAVCVTGAAAFCVTGAAVCVTGAAAFATGVAALVGELVLGDELVGELVDPLGAWGACVTGAAA